MTPGDKLLLEFDEAATAADQAVVALQAQKKRVTAIANLSEEIDARLRTVTRLRKKADQEEAYVDQLRKERQQLILKK